MKIELEYIVPEPPRATPTEIMPIDITYNDIHMLYKYSSIDRQYNDFLKNKKVIIIGPAKYIETIDKSEFFDSFDVVVRLNRSYPINNMSYGSRCDILYHNMNESPSQGGPLNLDVLKNNIQFISSPFPKHLSYFHNDIITLQRKLNNQIAFHTWADLEQYLTFHMVLQTRPNIGTAAILDLLNYDIQQLHISGITFFKDGYVRDYLDRDDDLVPAYKNNIVLNHAQQPQLQLIKLIIENDPRVTIDTEIKEIL